MKNMRRKLLSLLLVMAMVCSMVPSALASPAQVTLTATPKEIEINGTSSLSVTGFTATQGKTYTYSWGQTGNGSVTFDKESTNNATNTVTGKTAGTVNITVNISEDGGSSNPVATASASITVKAAPTTNPTVVIEAASTSISATGTLSLKASVKDAPAGVTYTYSWGISGEYGSLSTLQGDSTTLTAKNTTASATNVKIMVTAVPSNGGTSISKDITISIAAPTEPSISITPSTGKAVVNVGSTQNLTATVNNATSGATYTYTWNVTTGGNSVVRETSQTVSTQATSNTFTVTGLATGKAKVLLTVTSSGNTIGTQEFEITVTQNIDFSLTRKPSSTSTVYLNRYYYNDIYNSNWYNRTASFTVTPIIGSSSVNTANSYDIKYSWSITPTTYSSGALSVTDRAVGSSGYTYGGSTATVDAYYLNSSNTSYTLTCNAYAYTKGTTTNPVKTTSTSWTIRTDYTYHNYGSISASATVYANSTGYSLGSTDDAGGTSIVSELQSAVSSRYGYGSGWNSDRYYWDSSRNAWIDRTTGSIVGYDYNWNGWGNGWNNGYYGYDTLRYVTFSSVSTTGGSLSASTGTRYHVGGRTSYGSSALENVVFTPNGKSSTASFNITAYGDYGTYSGTITFNMSGTATPTTLTMSGTAGQNLNFKTRDFTSWWKGMYPSGNLSYVRFTSCSAGSLTNGVNGSSVVGNSTSCYASASGSQVAIGNLIYNSNSTGAATVTVNFTGYGSTTSSSSASTNRAGTLTITLAAGTPSVVSNLNVSYSCGASGVNLNATTFYNAVSASVTTASYITLGSPSSGTLTQNGVNVTSGSRFVLSGTSNNIGDVLYKPAAGFNGTATIPFVAYNSSNQTVATGNISIAVTQAAAPTTPGKTFPDTANHWSNTYVSVLASAGIVGGYDDGKFHPEREMTYGEALKLILLAAGYPEQAQGSGTNWAVNYLTLAINNGILPGSASSYTLSATVDRNTIAAMTAKALKLSPVTDTSTSPFVDSKDPYVLALNKAGIIFGDSSSGAAYYQGEKAFNRGEAAAIIYRIYNYRA